MAQMDVLWEWKCEDTASRTVTCLQWKPGNQIVLAAGYGELTFTPASAPGLVALWSLKHPEQPEWSFQTSSGDSSRRPIPFVVLRV